MSDPEVSINCARVVALRTGGDGVGRCLWGDGAPGQCQETLAEGFFCHGHMDSILSSDDLDVLSAWGRLQGDIHRAKKERRQSA